MDNKRLIVVVLLTTVFIVLWMLTVRWVGQEFGYDTAAPPVDETHKQPETGAPADSDPLAEQPPALPTPPTRPATRETGTTQPADTGALRILTTAEPRTVVLGSAEPGDETYTLQLALNSVGAGINEVVLNRYRLDVESDGRYSFVQPYSEQPNATRPLATSSVEVMGQRIELGGVPWVIDPEQSGPEQVTFFVDIGTGAGPVARVTKLIKIYPRVIDGQPDPRGGYEVLVRQTLQNLTVGSLTFQTAINGPTTPPRELEYGWDRMIVAGYRGRNGRIDYKAWTVEEFVDDELKKQLIPGEDGPLLWAGASSIYFNAIVRPWPLEQTQGEVPAPQYIREVVAASINPEQEDDQQRHVAMRFYTTDLEVPPGGDVQLPFRVFFGPKDRELLKNDYYASAGVRYDETLVSPFGCTWCVFQPVVNVLVWLLTGFYVVLRDWGLAIIVLVVVVRLLLHPITKRSQRSMMRMAKLGPEMEKLKKKYGDDKEAMAKAMGEFYREHGMAALPLGCLPMLLQTPIWIALYSTLQAELQLRGAPFLYGWTWIDDLAKPDNLLDFGFVIDLWLFTLHGINLLPLLLAFVFYFQMKLQPTPQAMTPEQQTQQTMMKWMMVLMFPLFLYKAPSGLNLYILTSTLIGIWESKRVRDQFKREEEAKAAEQPTLVKDKAPRSARGKKRDEERDKPKAPLKGWRAKWAQLQEQVQQAQQEAAKRSADRNKR